MKTLLILTLIGFTQAAIAQTTYTGYIDKYPIELVASVYGDGAVNAAYVYSNFDTPIKVNGTLKNNLLVLNEVDPQGELSATLSFPGFDASSQSLSGVWRNARNGNELKITLTKRFSVEDVLSGSVSEVEMIQTASMKGDYFRVVVSKGSGYPHISAVKIFKKKTDELQEAIEMDCQFIGLNNVTVGDYNFDGFEEFSVFETTFSGANSSRLYFLWNPRTKYFFKSNFKGVSLSFNPVNKIITETNVCCGGKEQTTVDYRVVDNKMEEVARHCFTWSEQESKLVESDCK